MYFFPSKQMWFSNVLQEQKPVSSSSQKTYNKFMGYLSIYLTLDHKTSLKSLGYICSNSQNYMVWVKIIDFSFMPKIIRQLRLVRLVSLCPVFFLPHVSSCPYLVFWFLSSFSVIISSRCVLLIILLLLCL